MLSILITSLPLDDANKSNQVSNESVQDLSRYNPDVSEYVYNNYKV